MVQCKLCGKILKNNRVLWSHLRIQHFEYSLNHGKLYYDTFLIPVDFDKKCPLCDNEKIYRSITYGYSIGCKLHWQKINLLRCSKKRKENGNYTSPNKGKKDSEVVKQHKKESRQKFLNSKKGKNWRKKISELQKGSNNSCHKMTKETKKAANLKISIKMKKNILEGLFTPCITNSWANSKVPILINGFNEYYRSTWDAVFLILNPLIKYEKTRIPYINNNNEEHIYIVDFTDDINKILYEIKPEKLTITENNLLKTKAAIKWCEKNGYTYKIVSNEYFKENVMKIDFSKYDKKIYNGMKQFL